MLTNKPMQKCMGLFMYWLQLADLYDLLLSFAKFITPIHSRFE